MALGLQEIRDELEDNIKTIFNALADSKTGRNSRFHLIQMLTLHGLAESPIINAPPGSGKTQSVTKQANRLFEEDGLPILYLIPNHASVSNVPNREHWNHWFGHSETCGTDGKQDQLLQEKGYWVEGHTGPCEWQAQFKTDRPTFAPIQYLFGNDQRALRNRYAAHSLSPMRSEVEEFPIIFIDELMLDSFVDGMDASRSEYDRTLLDHPDESVRTMCQALRAAFTSRPDPEFGISGQALATLLVGALESMKVDLPDFVESLHSFANDPMMLPWLAESAFDLPPNFAPYLAPILLQELEWCESGTSFNPRIHLNPDEQGFLAIRWRRPVKDMRPIVVLDATSSLPLTEKALSGHNYKRPRDLKLAQPENVKVFQYVDKRVTRTGVGTNKIGDTKYKLELFARVKRDLAKHVPKDSQIGIVTFMRIEDQLVDLLRDEGYDVLPPVHYNAARGVNELEHVDALVLFGTHIPNPIRFKRETQAFFFDEDELTFNYGPVDVTITTRDGRSVEVQTKRYTGDPLVEDYFRQKTWAEMYQAVHRARPNNVKPGEFKQIFIYTSDPIDGIEVDEILGREADYAAALSDLLKTRDWCRVADLAKLGVEPDKPESTVNEYIRRHREEIAHLAKVKWDGKRFSTTANSNH